MKKKRGTWCVCQSANIMRCYCFARLLISNRVSLSLSDDDKTHFHIRAWKLRKIRRNRSNDAWWWRNDKHILFSGGEHRRQMANKYSVSMREFSAMLLSFFAPVNSERVQIGGGKLSVSTFHGATIREICIERTERQIEVIAFWIFFTMQLVWWDHIHIVKIGKTN